MYVMYVILNFKTLGQVFKLVFFAVCAQSMCVFATSASSGKDITVGLKQQGLQQHSLMLSHDVNPTGPEDIWTFGTEWESVFLGWGSRQDEQHAKPLGIRKIVPWMPGIPSGNLDVWNKEWITVLLVSVCARFYVCVCVSSDNNSSYLTSSLFLLRPAPAVTTLECRIMGQLLREAYYGIKRQHVSCPNTQTVSTSLVIGIRLFHSYQARMWWCCGFLGYQSGQVYPPL